MTSLRAAVLILVLALGLMVLNSATSSSTAAPLAQATATPTSTSTQTPTATPTRNPADLTMRFAGPDFVPYRAVANGDGTFSMAVSVGGSTGGTPVLVALTPLAVQPVGNTFVVSEATITRPGGTPTAYPALAIISNSATNPTPIAFANVCRVAGGSATLNMVRMMTDQSTNTANYQLQLYNAVPPTPIADGTPFPVLFTNASTRVGVVQVPNLTSEGAGSTAAYITNSDFRLPVKCANGSTTIYGQLEAVPTFTPNSGQSYYIALGSSQD